MKLRLLALAAALSIGTVAQAWNATGHMVIAAIAQSGLTPAAKAETDRLLKIGADTPGMDDFVTVGPWADQYRNENRESGPWHYKDLYFRADGKPAANKPDEINAVSKIKEFTAVLGDKTKPDADRAFALRILIHLVGDIHQPLHASSEESDARPKGDRGGNSFLILTPDGSDRGPKNLHALWDGGAGLFPNRPREEAKAAAEAQAKALIASIPRTSLPKVGESDPDKWTEEGLGLAKSVVYTAVEGKAPDSGYIEKAQKASAQRAVLAGYRLADLLNKTLK